MPWKKYFWWLRLQCRRRSEVNHRIQLISLGWFAMKIDRTELGTGDVWRKLGGTGRHWKFMPVWEHAYIRNEQTRKIKLTSANPCSPGKQPLRLCVQFIPSEVCRRWCRSISQWHEVLHWSAQLARLTAGHILWTLWCELLCPTSASFT